MIKRLKVTRKWSVDYDVTGCADWEGALLVNPKPPIRRSVPSVSKRIDAENEWEPGCDLTKVVLYSAVIVLRRLGLSNCWEQTLKFLKKSVVFLTRRGQPLPHMLGNKTLK